MVRTHPARLAFTLIELLVVVAIISLLISILLPSLSRARGLARMVKCQAILKQVSTTHHMYANEASDWFVPHRTRGQLWGYLWFQNSRWRQMMSLPVGSPWLWGDGLTCPDVAQEVRSNPRLNYASNGTQGNNLWWVPEYEPNTPWHQGDYTPSGTASGTNGSALRIFRPKVKNPSSKIQNIDSSSWEAHRAGANWKAFWDIYGDRNGAAASAVGGGGKWNTSSYRHNEGANLLMFDGHVEYRPKTDVFHFNASGSVNNGPTYAIWHVFR